jgi:hypothetical protein
LALQKIEIIFVRARAQLTQKQTNIEHIIIRLFYTIHKVKRNINIYSKDVIEKKLKLQRKNIKMTQKMKEHNNERITMKGRCVPRYNFV